jgi:hypothetical protein
VVPESGFAGWDKKVPAVGCKVCGGFEDVEEKGASRGIVVTVALFKNLFTTGIGLR